MLYAGAAVDYVGRRVGVTDRALHSIGWVFTVGTVSIFRFRSGTKGATDFYAGKRSTNQNTGILANQNTGIL